MMKLHNRLNNKLKLSKDNLAKVLAIEPSVFSFSHQIASKYHLSRKPSTLPALIFLKLFSSGTRNQTTNFYRQETINNDINLRFNLYSKMINRLEQVLRSCSLSQKFYDSMGRGKTAQKQKACTFNPCLPDSNNIFIFMRNMLGSNPDMLFRSHAVKEKSYTKHAIIRSVNPLPVHIENLTPRKIGLSDPIESRFHRKIITQYSDGYGRNQLYMGGNISSSWLHHNVFSRRLTDKYLRMTPKDTPSGPTLHMSPLIISSNVCASGPLVAGHGMPSSTHKDLTTNAAIKTDMTFRKSTAQNSAHDVEERETTGRRYSVSNRIFDLAPDTLPKEAPAPEISKIADKVYKILEKRISIERERKGLY